MSELFDTNRMSLAQKQFDLKKMASLLDQAYLDSGREPSDRAKKSFAPSGIGYGSGTCPRQWYYAFEGGYVREEFADSTGIANMAYGTDAHARVQGLFKRAGILVEEEKKVISEDPPIFGFADVIIKWQGVEVVGEIKTTNQESFVSKKAKGVPAGYHLIQVLIYMKVLGLEKGFLLYENKNTQELLLLPVSWNEANKKLVEDVFEFMRVTYKNWSEDKLLPKRPFKSENSIGCKTCPFKKKCWQDEEGVVALPTLVVPK